MRTGDVSIPGWRGSRRGSRAVPDPWHCALYVGPVIHMTPGAETTVGLGTWPDWVAAVGTSAAFLVAAIAFAVEMNHRRLAQARLVYAGVTRGTVHRAGDVLHGFAELSGTWSSDMSDLSVSTDRYGNESYVTPRDAIFLALEVHNESDEIVGPVLLQITSQGKLLGDLALVAYATQPHGTSAVHALREMAGGPGKPSVGTRIYYRDSSNKWWTREDSEPIRRVRALHARKLARTAKKLIGTLD